MRTRQPHKPQPKSRHGPNAGPPVGPQRNKPKLRVTQLWHQHPTYRAHAVITPAHCLRPRSPTTSSVQPRVMPCTTAALSRPAEKSPSMDSHSNAASVLTPALLKMSHVPYSANSVNSHFTPVHTVQHQQRPVISVNNTTTQTIHTVNSQPPPNPVHTTTPSDTQTVQRNLPPDHQPAPANLTTQQLLHMLQPLLIHQHSTLTTINALLTPHLHQQGPPTPVITKTLTTLLQDCPTARHLLPASPSRPTRRRAAP